MSDRQRADKAPKAMASSRTTAPARKPAAAAAPAADAAFGEEIGRRIRQGRAKRGMTRRQLAQDSGASERYLAQIEGGAGNPSVIVMRSIAHALEMPMVELLPPV